MQLTYRGIPYNTTPPRIEPQAKPEVVGKYRGLDWRFCHVQHEMVQQPTVELKYRGVAYRTGEAHKVQAVSEQSRRLMMNRTRKSERRHQAMLGRATAEIGV